MIRTFSHDRGKSRCPSTGDLKRMPESSNLSASSTVMSYFTGICGSSPVINNHMFQAVLFPSVKGPLLNLAREASEIILATRVRGCCPTRGTQSRRAYSPPWLRRGGRDLKKNIAKQPCWERTGWFVQTTDNGWLEPTTLDAARWRACAARPSARANVASRNLLDRANTPPYPRSLSK